MKPRPKTQQLYQRLEKLIPGGVNSPVRSCKGLLEFPLIAEYGAKDRIYDVDGNSYIDYCGSWGALIHGHAHPVIIDHVQAKIRTGTTFGITTSIEEKLAEKVISLIPSIQKIRFVSSGTEATMTALRLARGFTGKKYVVKFSGNYHGHADFLLVKAGSGVLDISPAATSAGVPLEIIAHTICLPFNDVSALREFFKTEKGKDVAAVIVEPIAANMGVVPGTLEFIRALREETTQSNSLLIFDEVISGFRVGLSGAQGHYNVIPDLTCLGKIVGGGFAAAAFGGRKDIMDCLAPLGAVYQAGTLSGNPIAMEAGFQALKLLESPGFYAELDRKTRIITEPVRQLLLSKNLPGCIQQVGSMFTLFFGKAKVSNMEDTIDLDKERFVTFFRTLFEKGIYIPPSQHEAWFVSAVHDDSHLKYTRDAILDFLDS